MTTQARDTRPVIGIDLGGTNMQFGLVDHANAIISRDRRHTEADRGMDHVIERLLQGVQAVCHEHGVALSDIGAIGIASAGAIDMPNGVVLESPNLRWRDVPLRHLLEERFQVPVVLENDVNGAVWGEYHLGGGQGAHDLLGVWVGTGVGGGLVINGVLHHGDFHTAGEIGHTILLPDALRGERTVEDLCSRTGLNRIIAAALEQRPESILAQMIDPQSGGIKSSRLAEAYSAGDQLTVELVNRSAWLLGVAIANWVTVLAIDTVIIGGGVAEALGEPYLQSVRDSFEKHVFPPRSRACRLRPTTLRENAGLLGAALLARQRVNAAGTFVE